MTTSATHYPDLPVPHVALSYIQSEDDPQPDLPRLFLPKTAASTDEEIGEAYGVAPFERLPRILIPVNLEPGDLEPPMFHYGWRPNTRKMLAYAQAHGIMVIHPPKDNDVLITAYFGESHSSGSEFVDAELGQDEDNIHGDEHSNIGPSMTADSSEWEGVWPEYDGLNPLDVDHLSTLTHVLEKMLNDFKDEEGDAGPWNELFITIAVTLPYGDDGLNHVVTVFTNSDLTCPGQRLPTPEEMKRLGEALPKTLVILYVLKTLMFA
ncbi:hypothetical protein DAEQUDRAFT_812869 [Daedalea quercina L-15889]|uniref:Uncharacterized protein n=1 Tax=Daedalea quercina L-15889 TaxID=1314783 RepID=A0A165NWZ5_9APHY|nr:hypothetical protein DAEQUDRAFT_812869 [Daedalea quercina L-15889]